MNTASLLAELRVAGIAISSEGGRLIVEAPPGAVTAELRAELMKRKAELLATLETAHGHVDKDLPVTRARIEIAQLLAIAYRRDAAIQRVSSDQPESSVNGQLANAHRSSVHGDVP